MTMPFNASQFTATQFHTAEAKAEFANKLANFVENGFREPLFTNGLYQNLSNSFGHIAHFNKYGFYDTWFSSELAQHDWVRNALRWPCYGSPEYTFSDVEKAFSAWLREKI